MTIKAILIDDSEQALRLLQLMLSELAPEVHVLATAKNVDEGLLAFEKHTPDVVFLDIEMPEKSGLQFAEEMLRRQSVCEIIFTTAYNQYAINAFRLSAIDYLLKPIDEAQLLQAVEKIKSKQQLKDDQSRLIALTKNLQPQAEKVLTIPVFNGYDYVEINAISYLEADGSYTQMIMTDGKQKTISKTLKYFEIPLSDQQNFIRVHRSFIINIAQMRSFSRASRGTITMRNGKEIDLARDRRQSFFDMLERNQYLD